MSGGKRAALAIVGGCAWEWFESIEIPDMKTSS